MVVNMRGDAIDNGKATNEWAFIELLPLTSEPNPQAEGDWMLEGKFVPPGTTGAKLVDDGMNPNRVGVPCAIKANFTSNRAVAGSKIKQFVLAAFNKREAECKPGEIGTTWDDACRQKAGYYVKGWKAGDNVVPAGTQGAKEKWVDLVLAGGGFVPVTQATPGAVWKVANPLAGFVIDCVTSAKKKKTPNEFGAYVGQQHWTCVSPPGVGENTPAEMQKRLSEHASAIATAEAEDDGTSFLAPAAPPTAPAAGQTAAPTPPANPTPPQAPSPPTPPVDPNWPPKSPYEGPSPATAAWLTPGFLWANPNNGGSNKTISEADYRAGKRV
jgi:hypothetical protein